MLASQSPRRREMLASAGVRFEIAPAVALVDDTDLGSGAVSPRHWATALAYLKAAGTARKLDARPGAAGAPGWVVLGADTVVVRGAETFGKPRDSADAERIVRALSDGDHEVITGVCLLDTRDGSRRMFADAATVRVGSIPADVVRAYATSGAWAGKAGAYNLEERRRAGWPIECFGDPATVMGLPMRRLLPLLAEHRAAGARAR